MRILLPSCNLRMEPSIFYDSTFNKSPLLGTVPAVPAPQLAPPPVPANEKRSNSSKTIIIIVVAVVVFMMLIICICVSLRVKKQRKKVESNFSDANKLGKGGFGFVYKGDLKFKNEISIVAKLQHRNLVKLRGFCFKGIERLLIYEFVPNGSLDQVIFDTTKRANLDWQICYKIIVGLARGLLYLHEDSRLRIIHRDLKPVDIWLQSMHLMDISQ